MELKALWYCTKAKGKNYYLRKLPNGRYCLSRDKGESLNGKIVAECDFEVEEITHGYGKYGEYYQTKTLGLMSLREHSCISSDELSKYLKHGDVVSKVGYAIHIKNMNVFDKPKKISDFYKSTNEITFEPPLPLIKAPQNMCYAYDIHGNKYVVISVRPEWLCLILNGQKDIEVRKKVLKEML